MFPYTGTPQVKCLSQHAGNVRSMQWYLGPVLVRVPPSRCTLALRLRTQHPMGQERHPSKTDSIRPYLGKTTRAGILSLPVRVPPNGTAVGAAMPLYPTQACRRQGNGKTCWAIRHARVMLSRDYLAALTQNTGLAHTDTTAVVLTTCSQDCCDPRSLDVSV